MSDIWFFEQGGHRFGPVKIDSVRRMIERGKLSAESKVWNPTFDDEWKPIRETELAALCQPDDSISGSQASQATRENRREVLPAIAVLLILLLAGFYFSNGSKRPDTSQISAGEFRAKCRSSEDFNKFCKGKFVIWEGRVANKPDGKTLRVDVDGNSFDLLLDSKPTASDQLFTRDNSAYGGALISFSGYLEALNWSVPDISSAIITGIRENAQVSFDANKQKKRKLDEAEQQKSRAEAQKWASQWGVSVERYFEAEKQLSLYAAWCKIKAAHFNNLAYSEWESRGWLTEENVKSWRMLNNDTVRLSGDNMRTKKVGTPRVIQYTCIARVGGTEDEIRLLPN